MIRNTTLESGFWLEPSLSATVTFAVSSRRKVTNQTNGMGLDGWVSRFVAPAGVTYRGDLEGRR